MPGTQNDNVYRDVAGVYVSHIFKELNVRSALSYKTRPGDVFVVGFPKCGTTWMQFIILAIYNDGATYKDLSEFLQKSPFLEYVGSEAVLASPNGGPIKTHLQYDKAPFSEQAKYVYICRNPYDCCVSFYHHTTKFPVYRFEDGTFEDFLTMFLAGKVDFGDYFDHILSWYKHRNKPNILWVNYEDLKRDTRSHVLKIALFLGEHHATRLLKHPQIMDKILETTSIVTMKGFNSEMRNITLAAKSNKDVQGGSERAPFNATSTLLQKPMTGDFFRKGVTGDWVNHFTSDQVRRMKARIAEKTTGSDICKLWEGLNLP
ncbi:unnamed protein product [Ixodes persulcatus]